MPPKSKFKSMTNAVISRDMCALNSLPEHLEEDCTGVDPETRFKSVTYFMQNESVSVPAIPPQTRSKRVSTVVHNKNVSVPASISQNRSALGQLPEIPLQTRSKRVATAVHNESVSVPTSVSQNRSALGPVPEIPLQTRSKRVATAVHNESVSVPTSVSQNRSALGPLPEIPLQTRSMRVATDVHNERVSVPASISQNRSSLGPLSHDNGGYAQDFHPSTGGDERDLDDVVESDSSNVQAATLFVSKVRKTRGPTQKAAFEPPQGMKWACMFIRGQPVGEIASKLAGTLGLYARNESYFSPYKKWKQQSMQSFNDVMKEVMVHFDFVNQEGMPANIEDVNRFCFRSLQIKLKEWRCELKKKGYMKGDNEELAEEPPVDRITQVSWDRLVQYWATDEKARESERNKNNRAHEQASHTLGAKSIARHNQEQREKLGDNYTTVGAYIKAHQTKSGHYPNEHTRSICEKVVEACQEKDLMSSSDPTVLSPILDAICNGHHGGYERGCGLGWSRMSRWGDNGNQSSNDNIKQLTTELQNAKAQIEAMHAREREMEARMERMEAMLAMQSSRSFDGDSTCRQHGMPNNLTERDGT